MYMSVHMCECGISVCVLHACVVCGVCACVVNVGVGVWVFVYAFGCGVTLLVLLFREAHPELTGDDVVMSEARRSVRLAHKGSRTPGRQVVVSSLAELPEDLDFSYCPPSQL